MITNTFPTHTEGTGVMARIGTILGVAALMVAGATGQSGTARAAAGLAMPPVVPATKATGIANVNAFLNRLVKHQIFSGSVLVTQKGKVLMDKGYAYSNWGRHVPNTPNTKFRLADLTMQFTAMAILQLQQEGKLNVQDHVSAYLSPCPAAWKDVTIYQLLTHTSGVPDLYGDGVFGFDETSYMSPQKIMGLVMNQPLLFAPGTHFHYSMIGYIALGLVIEKVSGESYAEFLQQHIFGPLGMTSTGLAQDGVSVPNLARGYNGAPIRIADFDPTSYFSASALYSTVNDLRRWDVALTTDRLVSKASMDEMFDPYQSGYGYGWAITSMHQHRLIVDGSGMNGFVSLNALFPDDGLTVIVLGNDDRIAMNVIFPYIIDHVLKG